MGRLYPGDLGWLEQQWRLAECRLLRRRLNRERPKPGAELSQQMVGWFDGIQKARDLIGDRMRELKKGKA